MVLWKLVAPGGRQWQWSWGMSHWHREWRQLFSTVKHGQSYSSFCGKCFGRGGVLVVVKDTGGAVFGGFAGTPLTRNGDFYGNDPAPRLPPQHLQIRGAAESLAHYCRRLTSCMPEQLAL